MTTAASAIATTQVYRVYIKATPQAIWDAITKPEWTERYGYCGRVDYDLRPGGSYTGYTTAAMRSMGAPDIASDGEMLEADAPHKLVQTWRIAMEEGMKAEGFTRLTYEIEERKNGVSRLTLTHELEGAPELALLTSGGMEDEGAGGGWSWVLSGLKTLLETGESLDAAGHQ
jgi:uncharacterized protein YndB with AHSA1/START domain